MSSLASPVENPQADPAPLICAFISLLEQLVSSFFPKGLAPGNTAGYIPPHACWGHACIHKTGVEEQA